MQLRHSPPEPRIQTLLTKQALGFSYRIETIVPNLSLFGVFGTDMYVYIMMFYTTWLVSKQVTSADFHSTQISIESREI